MDDTKMNQAQQIKEVGLKVTGPRVKILKLFETHSEDHLSAEDIYRMILEEEMDIGIATVYRVLTQFEEAGILQRHYFESGKAVYELNRGDHHDHIMCLKCGKLTEFYNSDIEELQNNIAEKYGYTVTDHSLYIYGVCMECQNKKLVIGSGIKK